MLSHFSRRANRARCANHAGSAASGRFRRRLSSPSERRLRRVRMVRLAALAALLIVVVGILGFFGLITFFSRDLPQPGQVVRRQGFSTKIFAREGELLYDLFSDQRRTPVSIENIPLVVQQATVAIEDKDFYTHQGFDILTLGRLPYNLLFRQRVVGGSTLTQQLVKNVLLTNERTINRKVKELVLALQIERTFTKDQILEMYLNEAPYGGTAWGIAAAAETYFDKSINELSLAEAAVLAGLPQRPSAYSPLLGKTDDRGRLLWQIRAQAVLRRMLEDNLISGQEHDQALASLDELEFRQNAVNINAPHFVFYVQDQLEEMFGQQVVEQGGLQVITSLDMDLQQKSQQIVAEEIGKVEDFNISNGAAMVVDPLTGEILVMVGSKDFFSDQIDGQFNVAVNGLRQPGSSIKPVTYAGLLMAGYTPAQVLVDAQTVFAVNPEDKAYQPNNYDGQFRGPVSIRNALGSSINVPAVKALAILGIEDFLDLAFRLGFSTLEPTPENFRRLGLSVTLGGGEVHLIDTVTAYSSFANGGTKVEPVAILKVTDLDGNVLFEHRPTQGQRVVPEEVAFLINHILSDNNARLLAFGANSLLNTGRPIAVKTGTTNDQRDNWTIGWSQQVMVGAWVGNNDNSPMTRVASGITGASPIWRRIMFEALEAGYQAPDWQRPDTIEEVQVDAISGYPAHDDFASRSELVIKGTQPGLPDPVHTKLEVCRDQPDRLATRALIASGEFDRREFIVLAEDDPYSQDGVNRWQAAIDAWISGQSDDHYRVPTEFCGDQSEIFIKLKEPDDKEEFDDNDILVEVEADSADGIDKIEIVVDDVIIDTVSDHRYKATVNLSSGQHTVYAKTKSRSGKEATSGKSRIGVGGEPWRQEEAGPPASDNDDGGSSNGNSGDGGNDGVGPPGGLP